MKKRMLFIAHRIPYPPNKGDKIRSFNELRFFSEEFEIDLVTFVDSKNDLQYYGHLSQFCANGFIFRIHKIPALIKACLSFIFGKSLSEGYYYNSKFAKQFDKLIETRNYVFIFCFSVQIAQYVSRYIKIPRIMDFVDVDSDKWLQYSGIKKFPFNILYKLESKRLQKYEASILNSFSLSILSTELERELFNKSNDSKPIFVLNNGVDSEYFKPLDTEKEEALVFVGAMDYFPNIDAVTWFTENVFINLLARLPDLKFYIVGSNPSNSVKHLNKISRNIIVTGFVDDVRPFLARAKLAVMPLRIARGIQNKILEAMAMEIPVVINEKLYSSLPGLKREDVFIYKDVDHLINLILNNISQDELLKNIGRELRKYVTGHFNWNHNLNTLMNKMAALQDN